MRMGGTDVEPTKEFPRLACLVTPRRVGESAYRVGFGADYDLFFGARLGLKLK